MKFIEVKIRKFGGLQDFVFQFHEGFQCICGPNESGKSTLIAFIRVMFYGFGRNSKDPAKSDRLRYRPWESTSDMGGSLRFSWKDQVFLLDRSFGISKDQDRTQLWNETLSKEEILQNPNSPGEEILDISESEYMAVCQMRNPNDKDQLTGLDERISHLMNSGSEDVDIHALEQRLKRLDLDLRKKISDLKEKESDLDDLLNRVLDRDTARLATLHRISELKKNLSEIERKRAAIEILEETQQAREEIESWQSYLGQKQKLQALHGGESEKPLPEMKAVPVRELTILSQGSQKVQQSRYQAQYAGNAARKRFQEMDAAGKKLFHSREQLQKIERERAQLYEQSERMRQRPPRVPNAGRILLIGGLIAFIVLIAALSLHFLKYNSAIFAGLAGLLIFILSFYLYFEKKRKIQRFLRHRENAERKLQRLVLQLSERAQQQRFLTEQSKLQLDHAAAIFREAEGEAEQAARAWENEKRKLLLQLKPWIKDFPEDYEPEELVQLLRDFSLAEKPLARGANSELEEEERLRRSFEQASLTLRKNQQRLAELNLDEENVNVELNSSVREDRMHLREALSREEGELSAIGLDLPDTANVERELNEIRELLKDEEARLNACQLARRILERSAERFMAEASPFLQARTSEWLERLSGGKYEQLRIGQNFSLSLEDQSEKRYFEEVYYSTGTRDLLWLSLRLAAAEMIMSHSPSLPLLMDDSLTQLDRERKEKAFIAFEKYAREQNRQIILLTAECELAAELTEAVRPLK